MSLQDLQHTLENSNFQSVIDLIEDIVKTGSRLNEQYRHCQQILKDDPPTPIQQILHESCEAKWKITFSAELARLGIDVQKRIDLIVDLINKFSKCTGIINSLIHE